MKTVLLLAAAVVAYGQSPTFEVASIKAAPPPEGGGMRVGSSGGPGSKDPGRWTCENMSLSNLITTAYRLQRYQYSGPSWLDQERFNISAKVPEGATREQFQQMLQNLLVERFGLKFHREQKEMQTYDLVVAKNGPKLKETEPPKPQEAGSDPRPSPPLGRPTMGADGFPELPPGRPGMVAMGAKVRWQVTGQTTQVFAQMLGNQVTRPVTDATGLTGKYDFSLFWARDGGMTAPPAAEGGIPVASDPGGPSIFAAVQEQLGLKLEPKKGSVEMLVVDHVERTPTEN